VEADIHYPTDSSILADGIKVITRTVKKLREARVKNTQGFVDHTRKVKKRLYKLAQILKSKPQKDGPKKEQIQKITA
jgi:IS5 family transposase